MTQHQLPTSAPVGEQSSDITIRNLSLSFPIFHGGARSLKKMLVKRSKNLLGTSRFTEGKTGGKIRLAAGESGVVEVQALHDISLHIQTGERVGLIGHNGAGKSTLLRVLAGIYMPDSPEVSVRGKVTSLLDVNAGMNDVLTGRENITLTGLQKGLNMRQISQLEKDVEEFAQLEAFLDLPMRLYSSGMRIRLGFGLATAITPQILLMDEWFMAGDAHFQKRAEHRLLSVIGQTDILVITSHDLNILEKWCTRLIWMEEGHIRQDGPAKEVVAAYRASVT